MRQLLAAMLLFIASTAGWAGVGDDNPDRAARIRNRKNLVTVPEVVLSSGARIPAFSRPAARIGYAWTEGEFDEYGRYRPGYWDPLHREKRAGGEMVWVPGYRTRNGWVAGYWRIPERPGFTWLAGYYDDEAVWHQGRWKRISLYPPEKDPHPPHSRGWSAWLP